jgi:formate hydrogenlyase subunit 3/multisubunit Na+/H+ antiporter MnhD subunit
MADENNKMNIIIKDDRRQGQDPLVKALTFTVVFSFSLIFLIFILLLMPKTSDQIMFFRKYNLNPDRPWEESFLNYAFVLLIIQLFISSTGVVLNIIRGKRRNDKFHYSLMVFIIISLIGIIGIIISKG